MLPSRPGATGRPAISRRQTRSRRRRHQLFRRTITLTLAATLIIAAPPIAAWAASRPVITGLSPDVGPTNTDNAVALIGRNLTGARVTIDGDELAAVDEVSAERLELTMPAHRLPGSVQVRVTTPAGRTGWAPRGIFRYEGPDVPEITGLTPNAGPTMEVTSVVLAGRDLGGARVTVDGAAVADVQQVSGEELRFSMPVRKLPGTAQVRVTTPVGRTGWARHGLFRYDGPRAPVVTGVAPAKGRVKVSTEVVVSGRDLGDARVTVDGVPIADVKEVSDAQLRFAMPPRDAPGTARIRISTPVGQTGWAQQGVFSYTDAVVDPPDEPGFPVVSSIEPGKVSERGGTQVTIRGERLGGAMSVDFNAQPALAFTVVSPGEIRATAPPSTTLGTFPVTVSTPYGSNKAGPGTFITYARGNAPFEPEPQVNIIDPSRLPLAGGQVEIRGSHLGGTTAVMFGNREAVSFEQVSQSLIRAIAPPSDQPGKTDIGITTDHGVNEPGDNATVVYEKVPAHRTVSHCGVIGADETWDETSVHLVTCSLVVAAGVTLTVAPGTVVKQDSTIDVAGTLTAPGTADDPVVFTSINDDAYGGDTNSDTGNQDPTIYGSATIRLGARNPNSSDTNPGATPTLALAHTTIRYGGIGSFKAANITVTDSTLSPSSGIDLFTNSNRDFDPGLTSVAITNNTIDIDTSTKANNLASDAISAFDQIVPVRYVITGNTISARNAAASKQFVGGIDVVNFIDASPPPVISNNTVTNTTGPAIRVTAQHLRGDQLTGNTGTDNTVNIMALSGIIDADTTLPLTGSDLTPATAGNILTVAAGVTLTVAPGTVVKQDSTIDVAGTLTAPGTADDPVVFTSINDDAYGGDTNSDTGNQDPTIYGSATIQIITSDDGNDDHGLSADADFSHTKVRYGGISVGEESTGTFDSIVVDHSVVALDINGDSSVLNSKISDSKGVYLGSGASLALQADFSDVETVLTVGSGSAILKGRLLDKKRLDSSRAAVSTCPWYEAICGIDATRFDWGDGASPLGDTPPLACGAVNVDLKFAPLPERLTNPWPVPDCTGEQFKPVDDWVEHLSQADILVDAKRRACEDAKSQEQAQNPDLTITYVCDQVEQNAKCMHGILDVASSFYGAPQNLEVDGVKEFLTEGTVDLLTEPEVVAQLDGRLKNPALVRDYVGKIVKYATVGAFLFDGADICSQQVK